MVVDWCSIENPFSEQCVYVSYHVHLMLTTQTKKHVARTARKHLSSSSAGRRIRVSESDVFITSYPKSGNTWVRFLVANMLHPDGSTDFYNINRRVPDIYTLPDHKLSEIESPRYLKSHEYFDPRYPKVLYVVRDVRSVAVSYFHHLKLVGSISNDTDIGEFVVDFLDGRVNQYGSWKENVLSWIRLRGKDESRFKLIRYEDLKANCVSEMATICSYFQIEKSQEELQSISGLSSFVRMQKLEKKGIDKKMLSKKHRSTKAGFVRTGSTSDWKEVLDAESILKINKDCGELLQELGYQK